MVPWVFSQPPVAWGRGTSPSEVAIDTYVQYYYDATVATWAANGRLCADVKPGKTCQVYNAYIAYHILSNVNTYSIDPPYAPTPA